MKRIINVKALYGYQLQLTFDNKEVRIFDVSPYLNKGIFNHLKDMSYFSKVKICLGSIAWPDGQDFDPDCLYLESKAYPIS